MEKFTNRALVTPTIGIENDITKNTFTQTKLYLNSCVWYFQPSSSLTEFYFDVLYILEV